MIGQTISHYKIIEELGSGGMGKVYKAQDIKLDRFVALKFLPPHLSQAEEEKKRFIHEAKAASALDHPNICNIYEIDETADGQMFIAMACYQGESLKVKIDRGPLPVEQALDIAIQIARGLDKAHAKGIIHQDIKPANVLITEDGQVKIIDFGLAKLKGRTLLTKTGTTLGTVAYMSPEQTRGAKVDQRTDIWSLGVVLYEMLTCALPFKGDYEQAIIFSILNDDPEPLVKINTELQAELNHLNTKALAKNPDNRYQSMGELLSDLRNFVTPEYVPKRHYPKRYYFALGAFILLMVCIFYIIDPFKPSLRPIQSIAVLPFENYTGSDALEYFVSGMHSSLISDIGKISALRVISKTTSDAYKNAEKSISEIASELGVNSIVETSVLCLGDSICVQVKLVSPSPEEQQIWVQDYYEEKSQILNLYNKITKEISREINVILTPNEENQLAESRTVDTEAYDAYMKGQYYWDHLGKEDLSKAMEYFNMAIEKDPDWAPPYAGLAEVWIGRMQMGFAAPAIAIPKINENLNKAMDLDPNSANSYYVKALFAVWTEWNWEKGETAFLRSIELNPNNALCHIFYAHLLMILRRSDEALYQANLALELDPLKPLVMGLYAAVMIVVRDYPSAIEQAKKALSIEPGHYFATAMLEYALYYSGNYMSAIEAAKQVIPFDDEVLKIVDRTYDEQGYFPALRIMVNALEKMDYAPPADIAHYYIRLKEYDKAMEWLYRGYEIHDPNMPYIATKIYRVDQNPRFIELLKMMKLPTH